MQQLLQLLWCPLEWDREFCPVIAETSEDTGEWARAWSMLLWTFAAAGVYTLVSSHVAWLKSFPVFTWVGLHAVTAWGWDVTPSMGYIGQVC